MTKPNRIYNPWTEEEDKTLKENLHGEYGSRLKELVELHERNEGDIISRLVHLNLVRVDYPNIYIIRSVWEILK